MMLHKEDKILYILYILARYSVLLTSGVLCIISTLYAIGNIVSLEATNFFCNKTYDSKEIREFNLANGFEQGVSDNEDVSSCYYINRKRIDFYAIYTLNINLYSANTDSPSAFGVILCILYSILSFVVTIFTMYQFYFIIYDTFYVIKSICDKTVTNPRIVNCINRHQNKDKNSTKRSRKHQSESEVQQHQQKRRKNCTIKSVGCGIIKCMSRCVSRSIKCYLKWYFAHIFPYYYTDSKYRLLIMIFREWIEILIQFYALLLYGGYHLLYSSMNVLSQEPNTIQSFAIIVGLNSVLGVSCM